MENLFDVIVMKMHLSKDKGDGIAIIGRKDAGKYLCKVTKFGDIPEDKNTFIVEAIQKDIDFMLDIYEYRETK